MVIRSIVFAVVGALVLGLVPAACGGTSGGVGVGGDGGTADGSADGTTAEAASDAAPMLDAPSGFDVTAAEASPPPEGGDDAGCTGTGTTCRTCCRMDNAAGYKSLVTAELACACKPSVCGPLEAGAGDAGDASDLGVGACAGTCGGTALPDATCDKCLNDATGSMGDPGECYTPVSTACENDPSCVAYVTCVAGCM